MMQRTKAREKFRSSGIQSVSKERLVVLLYERSIRDVAEGREAMNRCEIEAAHRALVHAQQIIEELAGALRTDAWEGAKDLHALYAYVHDLLVTANTKKSVDHLDEAESLLSELSAAWGQAYLSLQDGAMAAASPL